MDTLEETLRKLNVQPDTYREHIVVSSHARLGEKVTEAELVATAPQSNRGPAASYDGPPTNILGQMEAGVVQARLRERTLCYRLIIGRGWLMLVLRQDEEPWLRYSKQYWVNRDKARGVRGKTIKGADY